MSEPRLSTLPLEARPYQGTAAGVVTRVAASTVDFLVVTISLVGVYAGYLTLRFVIAPREFRPPDLSLSWLAVVLFLSLVAYLTAAWWAVGRTLGDHGMGIRVVTGTRGRLRFARALARAVLCVVFPVGLLWCAVDRERRAFHDLVLRTSVVHDWLPRTPSRPSRAPAVDDPLAGVRPASNAPR